MSSRIVIRDVDRLLSHLDAVDRSERASDRAAFAESEAGEPWPECEAVVEAVQHSYDGKVRVDGYEVTLSKNGKFLNRKLI